MSRKHMRIYLVVFLSMFIGGYTSTMLFAFLPFMVQFLLPEVGVEDNAIYAGVVAGAYFLGRILTSTIWGAISDQKGRKPTLLVMALLAALASAVFGFSSSFAMAVVIRLTVGIVSGINGVSKAVLADASSSINLALGMSVIACGHGLGFLIGPAISGALADPINQYNLNITNRAVEDFLTRFPFVLPCLLHSALLLLYATAVFCLLEESLGTNLQHISGKKKTTENLLSDATIASLKERRTDYSLNDTITASDSEVVDSSSESQPLPLEREQGNDCKAKQSKRVQSHERSNTVEPDGGFVIIESENRRLMPKRTSALKKLFVDLKCLLCDPVPLLTLAAYGTYSFGVMAYDENYSVWAFTPPFLGGLGFSINQIGISLLIVGSLLLPTVLILYPLMERCFGSIKTLYLTSMLLIFSIVLLPSVHYIVPFHRTKLLWCVLCSVAFLIQLLINTAFCPLMLFINNSATADKQGLMNGLSVSVISITRTVAPLVSGTVFSLSLSPAARSAGFPLDFHLVFILLGAVFLSVVAMVACLPETINRPKPSNNLQ